MAIFHDHYPTGHWQDEIDVPPGCTLEGICYRLQEDHDRSECDRMTCPVCQWLELRRQATEEN